MSICLFSDPFGTPELIVADTARLLCCVVAVALMVGLLRLMTRTHLQGRITLCAGLLAASVSVIGTEIEALGTIVTYRLFVNCISVLFSLYGVTLALRKREP